MLSVSNLIVTLTDTFGKQRNLVNGLSFNLLSGKTLAVVGESGSGKSLSALAIMNLLADNLTVSGQFLLDGKPLPTHGLKVDKQTQKAWQRIRGEQIAMVFQEPMTALNPLHTIQKQISEAILQVERLNKAALEARVLALLQQVNIHKPETKLHSYPHELSGGQRQRVMIAMALAQQPRIIIADEPTTALDVTLQHDILDLLKQLSDAHNMALLLISHDLNLVERYSDDVIVMQQGSVIEQGKTTELFANPTHAYTKSLISQDFGKPIVTTGNDVLLSVTDLNIGFAYKTGFLGMQTAYTETVKSVSFKLGAGEALGIVGESGSGKTTIALALARLLGTAKVTGKVQLEETSLLALKGSALVEARKNFQVVFQDPFASLNPRMSVQEIVAEGIKKHTSKADIPHKVAEALTKVELPVTFAQRYPHELSGGQRQRIALARVLVMKPKLLLLDEPTSALDRSTQVAMVHLLRSIQETDGISYIFISHDLAVVKALCQHVLVLQQGCAVEMQSTDALFSQPQHSYTQRLIEASGLSA